jgi:hypothetical protein
MEKLLLSIPTLFGDHHTTAVRAILSALGGVSDIYVSSDAKQVGLSFDPSWFGRAIETAWPSMAMPPEGEPVCPTSLAGP